MIELGPEIIAPYLNPAYWDGRMVGQPSTDEFTRTYRYGQQKFANKVVSDYLENRRTPYPLKTFHPGEVVDANDFSPGTLFYGNRETLVVHGDLDLSFETTEEDDESLPEPLNDTGFELLDYDDLKADLAEGLSRRYLIQVDNVRYTAMRSFIIVTRGRRGKNSLQPVNEYALYRMSDGQIVNGATNAPLDNPIHVGTTRHIVVGVHEELHRINTLMLSSEAQAVAKTSFAEKLGNIGLNPFANNA